MQNKDGEDKNTTEQHDEGMESKSPDATTESMPTPHKTSWVTYVILVILLLAAGFFAYNKFFSATETEETPQATEQTPEQSTPPQVEQAPMPPVPEMQQLPQVEPAAPMEVPAAPTAPQPEMQNPAPQPQTNMPPAEIEKPAPQPEMQNPAPQPQTNTPPAEIEKPAPETKPAPTTPAPAKAPSAKPKAKGSKESDDVLIIDDIKVNSSDSSGRAINANIDEKIIQSYIMTHPEVVIESLKKYNQKISSQEPSSVSTADISNANNKHAPFLGNNSGNIVVIALYDYQCGYCKQNYEIISQIVKEDNRVKVLMQPVPMLGERSLQSAKLSIAAWMLKPEQFQNIHEALLNEKTVDDKSISSLSSKFGISKAKWMQKMSSEEVAKVITTNMDLARKIGLQGVPTYIVNGAILRGSLSYAELQQKISAK